MRKCLKLFLSKIFLILSCLKTITAWCKTFKSDVNVIKCKFFANIWFQSYFKDGQQSRVHPFSSFVSGEQLLDGCLKVVHFPVPDPTETRLQIGFSDQFTINIIRFIIVYQIKILYFFFANFWFYANFSQIQNLKVKEKKLSALLMACTIGISKDGRYFFLIMQRQFAWEIQIALPSNFTFCFQEGKKCHTGSFKQGSFILLLQERDATNKDNYYFLFLAKKTLIFVIQTLLLFPGLVISFYGPVIHYLNFPRIVKKNYKYEILTDKNFWLLSKKLLSRFV